MNRPQRFAVALSAAVLFACGGETIVVTDGSVIDTGAGSGGRFDSGLPGAGGTIDSGVPGSGGSGDAGVPGSGGTPGSGGRFGSGGGSGSGGRTGSGGAPGSGGVPGSGGGGGAASKVCKFSSGLNVAWVQFAGDVPNPDLATFNALFKNTHDAGGRIVRWWFHTNGTVTPGYDSSGKVKPLPQSHIDGLKAILKAAHDNGLGVIVSLWSFDMLQDNASTARTNNKRLLEEDAIRQSYVDNYLTPLVTAMKGTPGLHAWEAFNEPEGMTEKGWTPIKTQQKFVQICVNWFLAAIRAADPDVLVTNSAQTFDYCSGVTGKTNYYTDAALRAAGGKQSGTLDFYQVHYYNVNGDSNSPFLNPASYWQLDKKLVIGEFGAYAEDTDGIPVADSFTRLYDTGYSGAWAWSYTEGQSKWKWPSMQQPMKNLYTAHPTDIDACQ